MSVLGSTLIGLAVTTGWMAGAEASRSVTASPCVVSPGDVRQAVEIAADGVPRAYEVRSVFTQPGAETPAWVVTPLLRLVWHVADLVEPGDEPRSIQMPAEFCLDYLWFVFPTRSDEWHEFSDDESPFRVVVTDRRGRGRIVQPEWQNDLPVTQEWRDRLGRFGAADRLVIASFDRNALRSGDLVQLRRSRRLEDGRAYIRSVIGVIADGDIARWR